MPILKSSSLGKDKSSFPGPHSPRKEGTERKDSNRRTQFTGRYPCRGKMTVYFHNKMGNAPISYLHIIRNWHNFYNQSKRNVRKIPDTTGFSTFQDRLRQTLLPRSRNVEDYFNRKTANAKSDKMKYPNNSIGIFQFLSIWHLLHCPIGPILQLL